MSEDENTRQELQEAHITGDEESSSWIYDGSTRCKLLDILEGLATAQTKKGLRIA
jgi:hypothetical protein